MPTFTFPLEIQRKLNVFERQIEPTSSDSVMPLTFSYFDQSGGKIPPCVVHVIFLNLALYYSYMPIIAAAALY